MTWKIPFIELGSLIWSYFVAEYFIVVIVDICKGSRPNTWNEEAWGLIRMLAYAKILWRNDVGMRVIIGYRCMMCSEVSWFYAATFDLTILCLDLYSKVKYVFKVYILPMLALFVGNKNLPL